MPTEADAELSKLKFAENEQFLKMKFTELKQRRPRLLLRNVPVHMTKADLLLPLSQKHTVNADEIESKFC